ncbi:MAG: hypothetical protein GC159_17480 [Phycisphaera sp.]|nr:hypothetical protein [Phycisphaera sp.]
MTTTEATTSKTRHQTDPVCARQAFYERLAAVTGVPLHPWHVRCGHAWPHTIVDGKCWYHHVIVQPYVGCIAPETYAPRYPLDERYERPIPRVYVNYFDTRFHGPPTAQCRRWPGCAKVKRFIRAGADLELTTTLEQLSDFAEWVVGWLRARLIEDLDQMPMPPHALDMSKPYDIYRFNYLWTVDADHEYDTAPATAARKRRWNIRYRDDSANGGGR